MWLLNWIPDSFLQHVVNAILIIGVVSTFFSFFVINRLLRWFPPLARWVNVFQILSVAFLLSGVYFTGSYQTEKSWRTKVADAQAKAEQAEAEAKKANDALSKKSKEKVKVIQGKELIVKQYIDREVVKYDTTCPVPSPVVKALNAGAKQEELK